MRTFSAHHVRYRAFRVQEWAFYAAIPFSIGFIVCALYEWQTGALVSAILGSTALGVSVGAWVVGSRFKD